MGKLTAILLLTSIHLFGQVDGELYDIYSTVIKEEFEKREDTTNNRILIYNGTIGTKISQTIQAASEYAVEIKSGQLASCCGFSDNINEVIKQNPEIADLMIELKTKNKNKKLKHAFDLSSDYGLISRNKFNKILTKENGLKELKNNDSRFLGIVEFSNVAIAGDYAALYFGLYMGSLNAVGTIVILKRNGAKWTIISRPEFWVS